MYDICIYMKGKVYLMEDDVHYMNRVTKGPQQWKFTILLIISIILNSIVMLYFSTTSVAMYSSLYFNTVRPTSYLVLMFELSSKKWISTS